jgi:hypothetical protein
VKCAVHAEAEATGYCRNCGKAMCPQCTRDVRGVLYCEPCLATLVTHPQPPAPSPSSSSPGAALMLGFVPGLGAVYNGEYTKALIHIVVFIAIIAGLNSDLGDAGDLVLSLSLAGFIIYMAIDAHRTAKAKALGQAPPSSVESWGKDKPIGPVVLIALGVIFLLNQFGFFSFHMLFRFWPVFLIGAGVLMMLNRMKRPE